MNLLVIAEFFCFCLSEVRLQESEVVPIEVLSRARFQEEATGFSNTTSTPCAAGEALQTTVTVHELRSYVARVKGRHGKTKGSELRPQRDGEIPNVSPGQCALVVTRAELSVMLHALRGGAVRRSTVMNASRSRSYNALTHPPEVIMLKSPKDLPGYAGEIEQASLFALKASELARHPDNARNADMARINLQQAVELLARSNQKLIEALQDLSERLKPAPT